MVRHMGKAQNWESKASTLVMLVLKHPIQNCSMSFNDFDEKNREPLIYAMVEAYDSLPSLDSEAPNQGPDNDDNAMKTTDHTSIYLQMLVVGVFYYNSSWNGVPKETKIFASPQLQHRTPYPWLQEKYVRMCVDIHYTSIS